MNYCMFIIAERNKINNVIVNILHRKNGGIAKFLVLQYLYFFRWNSRYLGTPIGTAYTVYSSVPSSPNELSHKF